MLPLGQAVHKTHQVSDHLPAGLLSSSHTIVSPHSAAVVLNHEESETVCISEEPVATNPLANELSIADYGSSVSTNATVSHNISDANQLAHRSNKSATSLGATTNHCILNAAEPLDNQSLTSLPMIGQATDHFQQATNLNPEAATFSARDGKLLHQGKLYPDLDSDWAQVQQVQAGGVGEPGVVGDQWAASGRGVHCSSALSKNLQDNVLPFQLLEDFTEISALAPKQSHKVGSLSDISVQMPAGVFLDKRLPPSRHDLKQNETYTCNYYIALHNITAAPGIRADGSSYMAYTPNSLGARIPLPHVKLKLDRWRYHLTGYEHAELLQFLEFGFPVGLSDSPDLECSTRNHGSAYMWFDHVDKFICGEVTEGGLSGPVNKAPWWSTVISPLMTAHKKIKSRRTVFDATFGDKSLNNCTPSDQYMGLPCKYTFPKIQDFKEMILISGPGSYLWKRDLSRFFLQLPLDPTEYNRVGFIWRGLFFFFVALAFGLRHSGLQGQKVTDAVSWVLRRLGLEVDDGKPFQVCNYSDDLGGVEASYERALAAFNKLSWLLADLGLAEAVKKAEPPSTCMTYLGVQFDTVSMTMSVPPEKVTEIKSEIRQWARRTTISKRELQSLLGKLFWVSKVVLHSRPFMGRLLTQLSSMASIKDNKKVKLNEESRKDILWWRLYLESFNGINMIVNEEPIPLSYTQMLEYPFEVCAGDATPTGGGAWHGQEYWSEELPIDLQDPKIPIHIKEFFVVIVSAKLWGDTWTERTIVIYCDNDSVCDTVTHKKPKDPALLSLLREFLFIVVSKKFFPVMKKIGTLENEAADHISRRFDKEAAAKVFAKSGLHGMTLVKPKANFYKLTAPW